MSRSKKKWICVFCGSANGARAEYLATARELGLAIAGKGHGLVYGGATAGLMGAVADAALSAGGEVVGVIPDVLMDREIAHRGLTELHAVHTMHERKALMASRADAFVALPGGFGTMDEFLEILTWAQLRIHSKPCVLLNVGGYYDALLQFLDHAVEQGFLKTENRQRVLVTEDVPGTLLEIKRAWEQIETPVHDPKLDELVK
ncbi:hypothetical protein HNQ77_005136 [Silvibacterium bohemicum]|uniref:Cytokinin riboside 5'-monophosphate phosphoribohydrolase n=1 Tax=Silvibacterium bohemicum TaxID=1577686 RepID=A0A841K7S2_9BACT|nr:TIGR00730 family Rossman fold protein [Silvibacterium bohemicum]MBB6147151.1 hypothetical protein [Silvibacterium bohemicum]